MHFKLLLEGLHLVVENRIFVLELIALFSDDRQIPQELIAVIVLASLGDRVLGLPALNQFFELRIFWQLGPETPELFFELVDLFGEVEVLHLSLGALV